MDADTQLRLLADQPQWSFPVSPCRRGVLVFEIIWKSVQLLIPASMHLPIMCMYSNCSPFCNAVSQDLGAGIRLLEAGVMFTRFVCCVCVLCNQLCSQTCCKTASRVLSGLAVQLCLPGWLTDGAVILSALMPKFCMFAG